jgi:hypothetical protein
MRLAALATGRLCRSPTLQFDQPARQRSKACERRGGKPWPVPSRDSTVPAGTACAERPWGFSSREIRLDDLAPHRFSAFGVICVGCASAGRTHFLRGSVAARLVSICRSSPLQRMTRGRPVLIQREASRPASAQHVLPPLMGFRSSRTVRSELAQHRSTFRSVLEAQYALAVSFGWGRWTMLLRPPLLPPRVARCDLGSRIASSRASATNAVPFAQASPSNNIVLPKPNAAMTIASSGVVLAGRDGQTSASSRVLCVLPGRTERCTSESSHSGKSPKPNSFGHPS